MRVLNKRLNLNNLKGIAYEDYVLKELHNIYDIKEGYLWRDIPDYLLIESGILMSDNNKIKKRYLNRINNHNILLDTGIDIICKLKDDTILLVQCKAYSSIISQKHLSGFYRTLLDSFLLDPNKKIIGLIVHTNSLSEIITSSRSYTKNIVQDIYIPFNECKKRARQNYINIYISLNFINCKINLINIIIYLLYLLPFFVVYYK